MTALDTMLASAIVALAGAVVALWRWGQTAQQARIADQHEAAKLIFALLQRISLTHGGTPPKTVSTSQRPEYGEARTLALSELNGEIDTLLRQFLDSDAPRRSRA